MKYIIGIETTAHTFGCAVVNKTGSILSNVKDSYVTSSGGMIPLDVRAHHKNVAPRIYETALDTAEINEEEITAIALSNAPGLAPCLLEGMAFAKKIAERLNIPIIEVNHCLAHLEIGEITGAKDPVLLYASGANTQIIAYESGKYRIFGETLDIGVGNFIDTVARYAGLGFPGGPMLEKKAKEYRGEDLLDIPYVVKGMDVSFSGIQTKLKQYIDSGVSLDTIAYSMQETVFAMLIEVAERALAHTKKNELLLGGGVSCNTRFQEMCRIMCEGRGAEFFCPKKEFLVDNAAMIAYLGLKMYKKGLHIDDISLVDIHPRERTDEVTVLWKKG